MIQRPSLRLGSIKRTSLPKPLDQNHSSPTSAATLSSRHTAPFTAPLPLAAPRPCTPLRASTPYFGTQPARHGCAPSIDPGCGDHSCSGLRGALAQRRLGRAPGAANPRRTRLRRSRCGSSEGGMDLVSQEQAAAARRAGARESAAAEGFRLFLPYMRPW
jgi:hypothetical protein